MGKPDNGHLFSIKPWKCKENLCISGCSLIFLFKYLGHSDSRFYLCKKTKDNENNHFADDYTKEVLYMLKKSNVDISNSDIAYRGIQIAFASIQYSESMTYTSINAE